MFTGKVLCLQEKCYVYKNCKFTGKNLKLTEKYANFTEK